MCAEKIIQTPQVVGKKNKQFKKLDSQQKSWLSALKS